MTAPGGRGHGASSSCLRAALSAETTLFEPQLLDNIRALARSQTILPCREYPQAPTRYRLYGDKFGEISVDYFVLGASKGLPRIGNVTPKLAGPKSKDRTGSQRGKRASSIYPSPYFQTTTAFGTWCSCIRDAERRDCDEQRVSRLVQEMSR